MNPRFLFFITLFSVINFVSCDLDFDPCDERICYNGGVCIDGDCSCPDGWTGSDCQIRKPTVGETLYGGIIFYVDATTIHGLIAAPYDQGSLIEWGCMGTSIPGAINSAINAGVNNTNAINNTDCATDNVNIAAHICADLAIGEYSKWYLPSADELNLLYQQKNIVQGFTGELYWSSTEYNSDKAFVKNFVTGFEGPEKKDRKIRVRAISSF